MGEQSCAGYDSEALVDRLEREIQNRRINLTVERSPCMGHYRVGPIIRGAPGRKFYRGRSNDEISVLLMEAETWCGK